MNRKIIFQLFEDKAKELYESKFSQSLSNSGLTVRWKKGKGFSNIRRGPDYESIKSFVITFRNFILDSDPISVHNVSKIYGKVNDSEPLKIEFAEGRDKFNEFLNKSSIITHNGKNLTHREIIHNYIYGDVIHLEKHDEFKSLISLGPMKDVTFNEIVYILGTAGNFIYYSNSLNRRYLEKYPKVFPSRI